MAAATAPRQSADERRVAVLDAAEHEFAVRGLHGASTEQIAKAAGISQPYLFRLFGTKKDLYLATVQRGGEQLYAVFAAAAQGRSGHEALHAMGQSYEQIMQNHDRLMLMLKSWTACDDPDVARASREGWQNLVELAEQASGLPTEDITRFFANGMLLSIFMSLGLFERPEPWSARLVEACQRDLVT